jgi:hypothetical protein
MPASPSAATARIATTIRDLTERMRRGSTLAMRVPANYRNAAWSDYRCCGKGLGRHRMSSLSFPRVTLRPSKGRFIVAVTFTPPNCW